MLWGSCSATSAKRAKRRGLARVELDVEQAQALGRGGPIAQQRRLAPGRDGHERRKSVVERARAVGGAGGHEQAAGRGIGLAKARGRGLRPDGFQPVPDPLEHAAVGQELEREGPERVAEHRVGAVARRDLASAGTRPATSPSAEIRIAVAQVGQNADARPRRQRAARRRSSGTRRRSRAGRGFCEHLVERARRERAVGDALLRVEPAGDRPELPVDQVVLDLAAPGDPREAHLLPHAHPSLGRDCPRAGRSRRPPGRAARASDRLAPRLRPRRGRRPRSARPPCTLQVLRGQKREPRAADLQAPVAQVEAAPRRSAGRRPRCGCVWKIDSLARAAPAQHALHHGALVQLVGHQEVVRFDERELALELRAKGGDLQLDAGGAEIETAGPRRSWRARSARCGSSRTRCGSGSRARPPRSRRRRPRRPPRRALARRRARSRSSCSETSDPRSRRRSRRRTRCTRARPRVAPLASRARRASAWARPQRRIGTASAELAGAARRSEVPVAAAASD